MKILLCTSENGMDAGGLALHCVQLKEIFEKLGHEVFVEVLLTPTEGLVLDGGYDPDLSKKLRSAILLKNLIKKYSSIIDACVSCGGGRTAFYSMLICKEAHVPLYTVLCGSEVNLCFENAGLAYYNSVALSYSEAIIALSNELVNNARKLNNNPRCRYYVIPNYYDVPISCQCKTTNKGNNQIVFASGATFLGEKKGVSNLILAFASLINERHRNDKLYLFGKIDDDIREQYCKIISDNSLGNNVFLLGYRNRETLLEEMNDVDVYIQASPFEGFGNSLVEALCLGKDVLLSDTGYISEAIINEFPDHLFSDLNSDNMAETLYNFCCNTYYNNDGDKIRTLLSEQLSFSTVVKQWNDVLTGHTSTPLVIGQDSCLAVMFHDINSDYTAIDYAPEGFKSLVDEIARRGLSLCSAREFFESPCSDQKIICTFDDGYESVFTTALPILQLYGFTATVYICPDLIGKDNRWNHRDDTVRRHLSCDMIRALVEAGWEIGSHGLSHENLLKLSEHDLDYSITESMKQLKEYDAVESFCYPYGSFNPFIKDKVSKLYKNAFSVSIGGNNYVNDMYQITRLTPEELIKRLGCLK